MVLTTPPSVGAERSVLGCSRPGRSLEGWEEAAQFLSGVSCDCLNLLRSSVVSDLLRAAVSHRVGFSCKVELEKANQSRLVFLGTGS